MLAAVPAHCFRGIPGPASHLSSPPMVLSDFPHSLPLTSNDAHTKNLAAHVYRPRCSCRAIACPLNAFGAASPPAPVAARTRCSTNSTAVYHISLTIDAMSIAVPNYNQYLGDQSGGLGGAGSPTSSLSVLGGGASGWINQYDSSSQQQQDGRPPNKRRLSDGALKSCTMPRWLLAS